MNKATHKSVLLIDDDQTSNYFHRVMIRKMNNDVNIAVAIDGEHALNYISANGDYLNEPTQVLPDLILLDLEMPRMNGYAFLEAINHFPKFIKEQLHILVVASASHPNMFDRLAHYSFVKGTIAKPLDSALVAQSTPWLRGA